jgi:TatD DNase family protein
VKLTDTHCHLNFTAFDKDRDEVINRAWENGLERVLVPAIDLESSQEIIALTERYSGLYSAVGVHPNSADTWNDDTFTELQKLTNHPNVVAIGEIGLDYFRDHVPRDIQIHVFQEQLTLAAKVGLPVVVHTRNATNQDRSCIKDALNLLHKWIFQLETGVQSFFLFERPGVLHSFSGNVEEAERANDMGLFIGITGPVTFKNAHQVRDLVKNVALDKILLETDAPFLTPHPYRGSRNEPAHVVLIAERISRVLKTAQDIIAETTTTNAEKLFKWKKVD